MASNQILREILIKLFKYIQQIPTNIGPRETMKALVQ